MAPANTLAEYPGYAEKAALLNRWKAEANAVEAELRETTMAIYEESVRPDPELDAQAAYRARVAGVELAAPCETLLEKAERLRRELLKQRLSMSVLRSEVREIIDRATADAAFEALPAHQRAVSNILAAVEALREAVQAEAAARAELGERGFRVDRLRDFRPPNAILNAADFQATIWEREAKAYAG